MRTLNQAKKSGARVARGNYHRRPKPRTARQPASRQRLNAGNGSSSTSAKQGARSLRTLPQRFVARPNGNNGSEKLASAVRQFEAAVRYFQKERYEKAREILANVVATAPPEVADRARIHLRICEHRLGSVARAPKTAADFYLLGVADLNAGRLQTAIEHLTKAYRLLPKGEEVCYALAAAHARQGAADAALEYLKAAIDRRPQNRSQARQDADFCLLARDPRFQQLVRSGTHRMTS